MRVISGTCKGTKLKTLPDLSIRPTTDRVKESVFNIIQNHFPCRTVLDLFCGSGALGIEAMSRGAGGAYFVDSSPKSLSVLKENLTKTHLNTRAKIVESDYLTFLSKHLEHIKFDIVFADPPYKMDVLRKILAFFVNSGIINNNGIFVYECSADYEPVMSDACELIKNVKYGQTRILIYQFGGTA